MKFIICGGGTGGHVSPAIAIYEALKEKLPNASFTFIGRKNGRENKAYVETGEKLLTLNMSGINGKSPLKMAEGVLSAAKAFIDASRIIKSEEANAVIGTGGYVSWPVLTAAQAKGIPSFIHESNAYPGLTTRLVSKNATGVLLNYAEAEKRIKNRKNVSVVGNPIRRDFESISKRLARKKFGIRDTEFFILSFGGSLGSKKLNEAVIEFMKLYSAKKKNVKHLHATGHSYYSGLTEKDRDTLSLKNGCMIVPYVNCMAEAMHAADLVICRCGAMTLSEICAVGVASILIPSPNVSENHQLKNGAFMSERGAAILIEENELNARRLLDAVRGIENDSVRRESLAVSAKALACDNASKKIADAILSKMNL